MNLKVRNPFHLNRKFPLPTNEHMNCDEYISITHFIDEDGPRYEVGASWKMDSASSYYSVWASTYQLSIEELIKLTDEIQSATFIFKTADWDMDKFDAWFSEYDCPSVEEDEE